nr:homoserine O-acetyltransferase [Chitinophagaceae bacterium]
DPDYNKTDHFRASSYIEYQGEKLVNRFITFSYWILTKAMDSHNLARGRQAPASDVLKTIKQKTLIFGIHSDILCPLAEQQFLAANIPGASLVAIDSAYGHDGFMVEAEIISREIKHWLNA